MTSFIKDIEIYEKVIRGIVPSAKSFLWIGTADIKDLYVDKGTSMVPFLSILDELIRKRVNIRLIHAKEPGPNFRKDFEKYPLLWKNLERVCCPRVHFKMVIADGIIAYTGSANLTGAGMGAKSSRNRNFENGFITDDPNLLEAIMNQFDTIWMGAKCKDCGRKKMCIDRIDSI